MKAPSPSQRLSRNLNILVIARSGYFTNKGMSPSLLSTSMLFVKETNRISAATSVLPFIFDDNNRRLMSRAIDNQKEWERPELGQPVWTYFRKLGILPLKNQQIDDLLQLRYSKLLDGLDVPDAADVSLFWGGLTDFLVNAWSILEEFRLASPLVLQMQKETKELAKIPEHSAFARLISWTDMRFEHHLLNCAFRLRAGWDKLVDYLIVPYYGISNISKLSWPKRLNRLDKELSDRLNSEQRRFWDNILENAEAIAQPTGLRDVRDFELHKIARRSRQTLGHKQGAHSLSQLESSTLIEHHRLQDTFLLFLSLILNGPSRH